MNTRRMTLGDLDWSTELLTDAFSGLPPATHMFRGAKARSKLAYFMKCGGRYALLYGECHTTENHEAVAQWLLPGETRMTPSRMFKAGMFAAPLHFGLNDFKAFGSFVKHTDEVHRKVISDPHYYLLALGVAPSSQGQGAAGRLLRTMLDRADAEAKVVYLETQHQENVAVYERFGFKVASETTIPDINLTNWGMARVPAGAPRYHP